MYLKEILQKRGLVEVEYQTKFWSDPRFQAPAKPLVLAFGTGGGKTLTTIVHLELFFAKPENKNKKVVICPSDTKVLRTNFGAALDKFQPDHFSYCVATNVKEARQSLNDPNCNVVVVLPQTLNNLTGDLPKVAWFVLDEAQQWYFQKTIQRFLTELDPDHQLLLTGTPFKFHARADKYMFYHVSVDELRSYGRAGNARVQIVGTTYDARYKDFTSTGNFKRELGKKKHQQALVGVIDELIKELSLPDAIKDKYLFNRITRRGIAKLGVFAEMEQTIIFCYSIKQANVFHEMLSEVMPGQVLVSHSKNDEDSEEFARFKAGEAKVLLSVNRGKIGFDMAELYNIVDFSLTTNIDLILQILGRLLRKGTKDKNKIYYKVCSHNDTGYITELMKGVLSLTMPEMYKTYSGNGKEIKIPSLPKERKDKHVNERQPKTNVNVNMKDLRNFLEYGVLDLDYFRTILHSPSDLLSSVAWTDLDYVRKQHYGINDYNFAEGLELLDEERMTEIAKSFTTVNDLVKAGGLAATTGRRFESDKELLARCAPHISVYRAATIEECEEVASKYTDFSIFRLKEKTIYQRIYSLEGKEGYDRVCSHMVRKRTNWTDDMICELFAPFATVKEIRQKGGKGKTALTKIQVDKGKKFPKAWELYQTKLVRSREVHSKKRQGAPRGKYAKLTDKQVVDALLKYSSYTEAMGSEHANYVQQAKRRGLYDDIKKQWDDKRGRLPGNFKLNYDK